MPQRKQTKHNKCSQCFCGRLRLRTQAIIQKYFDGRPFAQAFQSDPNISDAAQQDFL